MPKKARKHKGKRTRLSRARDTGPKPKKAAHCGDCGEVEKLRSIVLQIDGKSVYRDRLCRSCTSVKRMAMADYTPGSRRK